jgi:probable HAF family extracellular repeat protein
MISSVEDPLMKSQRIVLTVGLAAALASHAAFAAPLYHLTPLDDFVSGMNKINASGQMAGTVETLIGPRHAYLYSGGKNTDLGIFPSGGGLVMSLNDLGQVVAQSQVGTSVNNQVVLFANGAVTNLGTPSDMGFPRDINNSGQIAGYSLDAQSNFHAILYSNGKFTDIGGLGGNTTAAAINGSGQIVGYSNLPGNGPAHAFRYSNGAMQDLGTLGGTSSSASDINASGQVVGSSSLQGNATTHAFVYTDGRMIDLGSLGRPFSGASGINDSGWIVGVAGTSNGARLTPAFVYDGTTMFDLNNLLDASGDRWTVLNATDINDAGWIAATGQFNGGVFHVLLTPVPEPPATAMFGIAIIILGGFAWHRRRFS